MTMRHDDVAEDWPMRPWIMAAICALVGLLFNWMTNFSYTTSTVSPLRQAGATFVAIAAVSFVLTVEQRRWAWALGFALGWGAVIALVGWFSASYNLRPTIFEWPFLSGVFAVLLAAPLFQTVRDTSSIGAAWRFPYAKLHGHAWTDAVIGAASLAFVGVAFLLAWLIAGLFDLIGIDVVKTLLQKDWFGWMLAGFAFGSAVGLLRERDALVATLQRLVMVVLGVLAPVLAAALTLFLLSLPFTGLTKLWDSAVPATPMMLVAGAGAILLANAVVGNGADDRATNRVLRVAALALVLCVLPLAIIAGLSLGQRIGQYGWTPERIWGVVAVAIAVSYGVAGWWSVAKGRRDFDDLLRPLQTRMAIGVCGLALFLALPIVDFGAISAKSQMARFAAAKVDAKEFDWKAMAFEFGPAGRERLAEIAKRGPADQRMLAATALKSKNRYDVETEVAEVGRFGPQASTIDVFPAGTTIPAGLRDALLGGSGVKDPFCNKSGKCRLFLKAGAPSAIAFLDQCAALPAQTRDEPASRCSKMPAVFELRDGQWTNVYSKPIDGQIPPKVTSPVEERTMLKKESAAMDRGDVEVRTIERRQLVIGGTPSGDVFE